MRERWQRWVVGALAVGSAILALAGRGGEAALASGNRLEQAEALRAIGERNFFMGLVWDWGLLLLLLNTKATARLRDAIEARVPNRWLADGLFFATLLLASDLLALPLRFLSGYQVGRRFGLNIQTVPAWLSDQVLNLVLNLALSVPALVIGYALLRRSPRRWWITASALGAVATIVLSLLSPVLIAPLFNRYEPVTDPELLARIRGLSERTGVPINEVLRVDMGRRTTAANAWVAGLWGTRQVVLGDTLMDRYTLDQVEAVLAHELGHVVHRDVWWGTLALAAGQAGGFFVIARLAPWLIRRFGQRWGVRDVADPAGAPLLALLLSVMVIAGMPLLNAGSRWRERAADRFAMETTSNPAALADLYRGLVDQNLGDPNPPRWHVWLFSTHPPAAERIAAVERFLATGGGE